MAERLGPADPGRGQETGSQVAMWAPFRSVYGDGEFLLGAGRVQSLSERMQFDCYFFETAKAILAASRMNRLEKMYYIDLAKKDPQEVELGELVTNLEERNWNRIPLLRDGKAKYIVHVSMIDRFIRRKAHKGEDISALTLADLLGDKPMSQLFSTTLAVVNEKATVDEARFAMCKEERCEDVFVTECGDINEPVKGWLTNHDLAS